ncbi:STAS domain-containing protein [Actinoplanes sp. DH11]|uniref:STAS domain-containing protein n=1 Tax=Actinoplanes sp. DH11 TaxID=2857011 RepID=UPI001E4E07CE|nr:STAS domain-containing protein [Actinoplanes sp. DH11]
MAAAAAGDGRRRTADGEHVSMRLEPSAAVVHVPGDIDLDTAVELWAVLETAASARPTVVVDLSDVGVVDSTGVGALVRGRNATRRRSGQLVLAGPSPFLLKILETMGLTPEFPAFRTVDEAVAAPRGNT